MIGRSAHPTRGLIMNRVATLRVAVVIGIIRCKARGQSNVNPMPEPVEGILGVGTGNVFPEDVDALTALVNGQGACLWM